MKTAKALMGSAAAMLAYFIPVVDDGLTSGEVLSGILAGIVAWNAVYWTPNKP